jgi:hypothetical protein
MDEFESITNLVGRFKDLGATRIFFKALSENDNSKQQVYLGGSFEVLTFFPHGRVEASAGRYPVVLKAPLDFWWVDKQRCERAPGAQLILYPQYPEVRLSGFLRGCAHAPSSQMRPVPKADRRGFDGRVLFFGTTTCRKTLAYIAKPGTCIAESAARLREHELRTELFTELPLSESVAGNSRTELLRSLRAIRDRGWVDSIRLPPTGDAIPYRARNGGGYTLEALLGIRSNASGVPDYKGWEIKGFSGSRITLMTPEPDGGFYRDNGVGEFVKAYGHDVKGKDQRYFTGAHRVGAIHATTSLVLQLSGFDAVSGTIKDGSGAIELHHPDGTLTASWSYAALLTHWNRKHAFAAYVPYQSEQASVPRYRYRDPILLGLHTDFSKFLTAMDKGRVVFDPGSKIEGIASGSPRVKARSQFRILRRDLASLYDTVESVELDSIE